jgi:hypothetical protein
MVGSESDKEEPVSGPDIPALLQRLARLIQESH